MSIKLETLISNVEIDTILSKLKKYGIAIIPSYLNGEILEKAKDEFLDMFISNSTAITSKHKHPTNIDGKVVRTKRELLEKDKFGTIKEIFSSKFMEDILKKYYSPYHYDLNDDIFFTHELPCQAQILPWHFDRVQSLKFFIYLKDTTINDGAFGYAPGTMNEGHYRANYHLATGTPLMQLPNDIPEEEILNPLIISGGAGDLIIFDPDGFHCGGTVGEGGERMVIRGHSHPREFQSFGGKLSKNIKSRLAQTPLNLSKSFSENISRLQGDEIKSKALKTRQDKVENL